VSQKGAIRVCGLERLLNFGDEIRAFAKEHDAELKHKNK